MASTHKKDHKSSLSVKVGVMRIPRLEEILESSEEESSSLEGTSSEEGNEVTSVVMRRTQRVKNPRNEGLGNSVEQLPEAEEYHALQLRNQVRPIEERIVVEQGDWDIEPILAFDWMGSQEEDSLPLEPPVVLPGEEEQIERTVRQFNQEVTTHPLNTGERISRRNEVSISEIQEHLGNEMAELRNLMERRNALFEELEENVDNLEIKDDMSVDSAGNVNLYAMNSGSSLYVDIKLCRKPVKTLIDSGAERNFISEQVMKRLGLSTRVKDDSYLILLANSTKVQKLGTYQVILGIKWMRKHNPIVDWRKGLIVFLEDEEAEVVQSAKGTKSLGAIHADETTKHIPEEYHKWLELFTERPDDSALLEHKL
ncbi:hypothetical protein B7463_g3205, partial [Scytalidium lignicola]